MAQVRAELGGEALILATRRVDDGVEVTAALEPEDILPPPDPATERMLAWHGVPGTLAAQLATGSLETSLAGTLRFAALALDAGDAPLLLAGPPGVGKTLTVARLATRLVMAGVMPLVITADGRRAGATEQLAAFTRLLGLTLIVASTPVTLARALARREDGAPVLIDAPGIDPFDPAQRDEIAGLASTVGAVTALVLPGGVDAAEASDIAGAFAEGGASLLVATRLDVARRLGGVVAASHSGGLALAEAGVGPGAADGLTPLTPVILAARLARGCPTYIETHR